MSSSGKERIRPRQVDNRWRRENFRVIRPGHFDDLGQALIRRFLDSFMNKRASSNAYFDEGRSLYEEFLMYKDERVNNLALSEEEAVFVWSLTIGNVKEAVEAMIEQQSVDTRVKDQPLVVLRRIVNCAAICEQQSLRQANYDVISLMPKSPIQQ